MLYTERCASCHGLDGGGNGEKAALLDPLPRSFHLGIFEWATSVFPSKPSRLDLSESIRLGVPETAMKVHAIPPQEMSALVEYVRWLTMRGDARRRCLVECKNAKSPALQEVRDRYADLTEQVFSEWRKADDAKNHIIAENDREPTDESVERGALLFVAEKHHNCHGYRENGIGIETTERQRNR